MQELGAPPECRGADNGAVLQIGDAPHVACDQHVASILAWQEGRDGEPRRLGCRHVLHAVDRGVDAPRQQRFLDFLDEQALAAGLRQRPILDGIARGLDGHDLDGAWRGEGRHCGRQCVAHQARLGEGELAAACAQSQEGKGHGVALAYAG